MQTRSNKRQKELARKERQREKEERRERDQYGKRPHAEDDSRSIVPGEHTSLQIFRFSLLIEPGLASGAP